MSGKGTKGYYKEKNVVLEGAGTMARPLSSPFLILPLFRVLPMVLGGGGVLTHVACEKEEVTD